ncbi:MAG TPA: DUF6089 family protein [Cytophagales bacterium]|jgi:hypothetical protein
MKKTPCTNPWGLPFAPILPLTLLLLLALAPPVRAQSGKNTRNQRNTVYRNLGSLGSTDHSLKITAGVGAASYQGELGNVGQVIRPMFGGGILYKIAPHLSFKGEMNFFRLGGDDANGSNPARNLSFESRNLEAYAGVMYELFDVDMYSRGQGLIVNPYAFAGLGFVTVNPTAELAGRDYNLRRFRTEDVTYPGASLMAPVGAGVRFELTRRVGLALEAGYRFTFSDYLDDVSTTYPVAPVDPLRASLMDRGPEVGTAPAEPGALRGNPNNKDGYLSLNLKVEYLLFPINNESKPKCPAALKRKAPKVKKK